MIQPPSESFKAAVPSIVANGTTTLATGDPTLVVVGGGLNLFLDWVKNFKRFPEETMTVPLLILLSFGIAFLVWYLRGQGDPVTPIIAGFGTWVNAHTNYKASVKGDLGVIGPTQAENKFGAN